MSHASDFACCNSATFPFVWHTTFTFRVVSGSRDCTIRLWDFYQGALLRVFRGHRAAIRCVKFDGRRIVSGGYDNVLIIWDAFAGQPVHVLEGHVNRVYSLLVKLPLLVNTKCARCSSTVPATW